MLLHVDLSRYKKGENTNLGYTAQVKKKKWPTQLKM